MKNNNEIIISAPITTRFFAFIMDAFLLYVLRFFYVFISFRTWLKKPVINFIERYNLLYGEFNPKTITNIEVNYFLRSNLFKSFIILFIGAFLISVIYNILFLSTKWSATIGQKIMGIYTVSKNGEKITIIQVILRSILVIFPWVMAALMMFFKFLSDFGIENVIDKNFVLLFMILFLSWYDLTIFTKSKSTLHDILTNTRVIFLNPNRYSEDSKTIFKFLFPDVKQMFYSIKDFAKNQKLKADKIKKEYSKEKENKKNNS